MRQEGSSGVFFSVLSPNLVWKLLLALLWQVLVKNFAFGSFSEISLRNLFKIFDIAWKKSQNAPEQQRRQHKVVNNVVDAKSRGFMVCGGSHFPIYNYSCFFPRKGQCKPTSFG